MSKPNTNIPDRLVELSTNSDFKLEAESLFDTENHIDTIVNEIVSCSKNPIMTELALELLKETIREKETSVKVITDMGFSYSDAIMWGYHRWVGKDTNS